MLNNPQLTWPVARLGEALGTLARCSRLGWLDVPNPGTAVQTSGVDTLVAWLEAAADGAQLEIKPSHAPYGTLPTLLKTAGPAILAVPAEQPQGFLLLLRACRRDRLILIGTDHRQYRVAVADVIEILAAPAERRVAPMVASVLEAAAVPPRRTRRAHAAMLRDLLWATDVGGCFQLRRQPSASMWKQLRQGGLLPWVAGLVGSYLGEYLFFCLAWYLIGLTALEGRRDDGWLTALALTLLGVVVFQMVATWSQGVLAYGIGTRLKRRLMNGALRLHPDKTRSLGLGRFLGRVFESEAVESLALGAGFGGLLALTELLVAASLLPMGASGVTAVFVLCCWTVLVIAGLWSYGRQRSLWNRTRLAQTHALVESMVGHKTRSLQQAPEHWHTDEDHALAHYANQSETMDRTHAWLWVLAPRGWLLLGLVCLAPAFVAGTASPTTIAIALGATLLAQRGMIHLVDSIANAIDAVICWQRVAPLYRASSAGEQPAAVPDLAVLGTHRSEKNLLEAQGLSFRYANRPGRSLVQCDLHLSRGDRILLEGASGAGKSTLAAILAGLRNPESGVLVFGGLDRSTIGDRGCRRRVAAVPQFQENRVFTASFAFNLLLAGNWPPSPRDLARAQEVCDKLGLAGLLARMPGGLMQMIGENGWHLSHGERSRLYVARALLQPSDVLIIDEGFAALDPTNLKRCLQTVREEANALLLIAHP